MQPFVWGDLVLFLLLSMIFFLAIAAIAHGYRGLKTCRDYGFSRKDRFAYCFASILHMGTGIVIAACFAIVMVLLVINFTTTP